MYTSYLTSVCVCVISVCIGMLRTMSVQPHIHDDNNEDYGCADVIYNLYRLVITRNIHLSIPNCNKSQLLTFMINYIIMSLDLFTHSTSNTLNSMLMKALNKGISSKAYNVCIG